MTDQASIQFDLDKKCLLVSGEINFTTIISLLKESWPLFQKQDKYIVDFSNASFSNSAVLALLLEWIAFSHQTKKPIFFQNLPKQLISIAAISGMDKLLASYS